MVIGSGEQDVNTAIISLRFEQQKQEIKEYFDEESRIIKDDMIKEANDRQRLEIRQSYTFQVLGINIRRTHCLFMVLDGQKTSHF